ncbi:MAG: AraC family transcriptional regulator [Bacteroidales bacterium]|nr:AraC family transcriptional regulator [Bacteroidales bacterium]
MIQPRSSKIIIASLFLFLCFNAFSANEFILTEESDFHYVYIQTNEPYSKHDELMRQFYQECMKQNLEKYITGKMLTIYFDDDVPLWRIGFEIKTQIRVDSPLTTDEINYKKCIQKQYTGNDIKSTIQILKFRLQEMELIQTGPTIIKWTEKSKLSEQSVPEVDIIIPTSSTDSTSFIIAKTSRYIVLISIVLYLMLGFMVLIIKTNCKIRNLLLAFFLFSSALVLSGWIVGAFQYSIFSGFPFFYYIANLFCFLPAPLLFLYTRSLIKMKSRLIGWDLLHFIPFTVSLILWIDKFYIQPAEVKRSLILSEEIFSNFWELTGFIVLNGQIIGYIGAALVLIYTSRKKVKNLYGMQNMQYSWLNFILWGFLVTSYIAHLKHLLYNYIGVYSELLYILRISSNLAFVIVLFYKGVLHPYLFMHGIYPLSNGRDPSLSRRMFEQYRNQLIDYMNHHKPYLIPEITLAGLSNMTSIPQRSLSEVINKGFQQNFFEFINSFRIEEAKKLIGSSVDNNKTILEILYEVGFNNKSVFNASFKKLTGKTPTEYRLEGVS